MFPHILTETAPKPQPRAPSYNVGCTYGFFPPVHLVYVHGFRGDHTSFQRFPTDLHYSLEDRIPSLTSHVYPTYKSRKPLQVSVDRLLMWLKTLEQGFIVLVGHSLGGFVVAEAALQYRQAEGQSQVIGVIAMDVPYLGVHPHVVISGLASLLPADKPVAEEDDLNDTDKVNMVNPSEITSITSESDLLSPDSSPSRSPSPSPLRSGRASPNFKDMSTWKLPDLTPGPTMKQNAAHFFRKHSHDPIKAMSDWLVSHWEHGSMLLDPSNLVARYERLERWSGGDWVVFYTETVPEAYRQAKRSRSRSRSPYPSRPGTPHEHPGTITKAEKKDIKVLFPQPSPWSSPTRSPQGTPATEEPGVSTFCAPSTANDAPTIKFPEPEPLDEEEERDPASSRDDATRAAIDLGSSEGHSQAETPTADPASDSTSRQPEEKPQTESGRSSPSTASVLSLVSEPFKAAMIPSGSKSPPRPSSRSSTRSSKSQAGSTQLTEGDEKKRNKLVKQQKKDETKEEKAKAKEEKAKAKEEEKAKAKEEKAKAKEEKAKDVGPPRHFIVTPPGSAPSRARWERAPVAGAASEVDAHCGIFFREKNWHYDEFVERVAQWVGDLCERKAKDALAY